MRQFLANKLAVNGHFFDGWTGVARYNVGFKFHVADVNRAGMLRWYLALNGGGTPHTAVELERVRLLLEAAEASD